MLRVSDFQERARIIFHRRILHCPKRVPPWNHAAALAPRLFFVLWKYVFSFCFVLCCSRLKRVLRWTRAAALAPWFVAVLAKHVAFLRFSHGWPRLNRMRLECDSTLSLSREAQVCILWTLGAPLFHWLASFQVDTFLCEGVICLRRKLALVFRKNPFSLNELIGYVDLAVFHEIWSEHSLIDLEQKGVGEFFYFNYFLRGGL